MDPSHLPAESALDRPDRGDAIMELDSRAIINAFTRTLKDLGLQAVNREDAAKAWLASRVDRLTTPSSDRDG